MIAENASEMTFQKFYQIPAIIELNVSLATNWKLDKIVKAVGFFEYYKHLNTSCNCELI